MSGDAAEAVADLALAGEWTVGTAESVTAGSVAAALAAAPDASTWLRGGIVAYSTELKRSLLDVPDCPVVSQTCAEAMAAQALRLLDADIVVSTTGVGGPEPADGEEPGTVWIAVAGLGTTTAHRVRLKGLSPAEVVEEATALALRSLRARMAGALERSPFHGSSPRADRAGYG